MAEVDSITSDQMKKVFEIVRSQDIKIVVISNGVESLDLEEDKALGTNIATELNQILSGSKALVYEYVINDDKWLDYLLGVGASHYIFIGLPPHDEAICESEFFYRRSSKITEVVVVGKYQRSEPVHYFDRYLHVEGSPRDIACKALAHFAG